MFQIIIKMTGDKRLRKPPSRFSPWEQGDKHPPMAHRKTLVKEKKNKRKEKEYQQEYRATMAKEKKKEYNKKHREKKKTKESQEKQEAGQSEKKA